MISEGSCDTEDWSNDAENCILGCSGWLLLLYGSNGLLGNFCAHCYMCFARCFGWL